MEVCTIIAKNYVAQARLLARSFAEHHPGSRLRTLIIDEYEGFVDPAEEPFDVLTPAEIGCDEFLEMAARYSVLELSTAVKPWLLRHLMGQTGGPVTYLDPDIKVYGSLTRLEELAAEHGVVLIPHNSEPLPPDGRRPSQVDVMIAGVYNLGYVSLAPRPDVERLIDWWADRLRRDCRVDPLWGYFVDQRWFDLTPGFLGDFAIVRDPEYNVAYWNVHSRTLERDGDRYLVDGRPLAFFHFSGFDPEQPDELSRHQDRVELTPGSVLAQLCNEYAADVVGEGLAVARQWPYTYGFLGDEVPFDDTLRRLFLLAEEEGLVSGSPLTREGAAEFLEWASSQQPDAPPGVSRLLAYVYGTRPDLQAEFPDLAGSDLRKLFAWTQGPGREEVPSLARLRPPRGSQAGPVAAEPAPPPAPPNPLGVNVVAEFEPASDSAEEAVRLIRALDSKGIRVMPLHASKLPDDRAPNPYTQFDYDDADYPVNLIALSPARLQRLAAESAGALFESRFSIGLWSWPVNGLPASLAGAAARLAEVWLPSEHSVSAVAASVAVPTVKMPPLVEVPPIVPRSRPDLGVPEGFLFLATIDYREMFERRNVLAVIDAFKRAFEPGAGPSLAVVCSNTARDPTAHQRVLAAAEEHPDVCVIERSPADPDRDTLLASSDCYVSLHRATSFGYQIAAAMYCGTPVVATGYSGSLEFMSPDNSLLVDHRLVAVGAEHSPYPADAEWAEPDVGHAARLMRTVFDDPERASELGRRGAETIRERHSLAAVGAAIERRLDHLRERFAQPDHPAALVAPTLGSRVAKGPTRSGGPRRGALRSRLRRAFFRALRPLWAYQHGVNAETVGSLERLDDELRRTKARLIRSDAAASAAIRRLEELHRLTKVVEAQAQRIEEIKQLSSATPFETDREIYLAVAELRRAHERIGAGPADDPECGELTPWELRAFSQNGEDGALAEILRRIGAPERYFVEFGVESGREANCVFLADVAGWNGLFIEGDRRFFAELERKYQTSDTVTTLHALVTSDNVQELFAQAGVPSEFTVLSIDVDGSDYWIWEAIEEYRPRVVIVEYNSVLDPMRRLVQPREHGSWDGTDYFGASLGAIRSLGESKGYRLVHTELSGNNAFLVRAELAEGRFPAPDQVPMRSPNYYQSGYRHPVDPLDRHYLDLDRGELTVARRPPSDTVNGSEPESGTPAGERSSAPVNRP